MRNGETHRAKVLTVALVGATSVVGLIGIRAGCAQGAQPVLLGQFGDWAAYAASQNGQRVCFALASPQSLAQGRGKTFVMISVRPSGQVPSELSIQMDYAFSPGVAATAELGIETLALFTKDHGAWLRNASDEARIIDIMRSQPFLVVKGTSAAGMATVDRYSLRGMGPALDRAGQECRGGTQAVATPPNPQPGGPPPNPQPGGPPPQQRGTACERFPNLC